MGRKPTVNLNLPQGMRARHRGKKTYYFLDTGGKPRKEIALGTDYPIAVRKWAELQKDDRQPDEITFFYAAQRYMKEVLPTKALATQKGNIRELDQLLKVFNDPPAPLSKIKPVHIKGYLDWRKDAPVRANREKALFSHIFNFARSIGLTDAQNPCAGVKGNREKGRDNYVSDEAYNAVWACASEQLRDAMQMAYLSGQRPADVMKLTWADYKDGALHVQQNKTGKRLRIAVEGELATLVRRVAARKITGIYLLQTATGQPINAGWLRREFDRARAAAATANPDIKTQIEIFQFRDLRAKAGTDKEESEGMAAAQDQLGHSSAAMTAHYVRHRNGKLVKPTK